MSSGSTDWDLGDPEALLGLGGPTTWSSRAGPGLGQVGEDLGCVFSAVISPLLFLLNVWSQSFLISRCQRSALSGSEWEWA